MPPLPYLYFGCRGGVRGPGGPLLARPLPHCGDGGAVYRNRHHPAGDDAGGYRRGGKPRGRAVQAPGGQNAAVAPGEQGDPPDRRRVRGAGIRHRQR